MRKLRPVLSALFALILIVPTLSAARAENPPVAITGDYVPNQIIVGYRNQGNASEMAAIREQVRKDVAAKSFSQVSPLASDTELVELGQGISVGEAMARLRGKAGVRFVEPNYIYTKMATSNDLYFTNGSLWGMYGASTGTVTSNQFGSNAAAAWNLDYTGSNSVVIGVIDEGIQITHPDLAGNIWVNSREVAGNRIDDDGNGYVDDINGWDFVSNDNTVDDGPSDDHGTHVSGTIGARGNNSLGVAGVNWNVTLISAKFLGSSGGSIANAIAAVDYLTALKKRSLDPVNIVATSNSWGGGGYSQGLQDAINRAGNADILFIAAAGNGDRFGNGLNNDSTPSYPASYTCVTTASWDCVISVASITSSGSRSTFSNYGLKSVDLGAPGSGIWSTLPGGTYGSYSGTSMATPHVSGAAALCKSINPALSGSEIRNAIFTSVAPTNSLAGITVTGGRLDVGAMASLCKAGVTPKNTQATLSISNTILNDLPGGTAVTLTTTGGSGTGAVTFNTTSSNCTISPSGTPNTAVLRTIAAPTSCVVTATKAADIDYQATTSAPVTFNFIAIDQENTLNITNSTANPIPKGNTGISLNATGGSGTGAITFALVSGSNTNCVLRSNKLTVSQKVPNDVLCTVTATRAASGNYKPLVSPSKTFTFR